MSSKLSQTFANLPVPGRIIPRGVSTEKLIAEKTGLEKEVGLLSQTLTEKLQAQSQAQTQIQSQTLSLEDRVARLEMQVQMWVPYFQSLTTTLNEVVQEVQLLSSYVRTWRK